MEASGLFVRAYHASLPSFGEWGYLLAAKTAFEVPAKLPEFDLRFLTPEVMASLFVMSGDMSRVEAEVNRLNNQILVQYYESEWARWN
jgi:spermidine synthase